MYETGNFESITGTGTKSDNKTTTYYSGLHFSELIKPLKMTRHENNNMDDYPTHMLSESSLQKEWLSDEENEAWDHL